MKLFGTGLTRQQPWVPAAEAWRLRARDTAMGAGRAALALPQQLKEVSEATAALCDAWFTI